MTRHRRDWRDTVQVASDMALLGILMTVAVLPVVTAGAAVAVGSAAVHLLLEQDRWPTARESWSVFRRALLPGLVAVAGCAVLAGLLGLNVMALRAGVVPGGAVLIAATSAAAALAAGWAALVVVAFGVRPGSGWLDAARRATSLASARPVAVPAAAGVLVLAGVLTALVHPAVTPVLMGFTLFALHSVHRRLRGDGADRSDADDDDDRSGAHTVIGAPDRSSPESISR